MARGFISDLGSIRNSQAQCRPDGQFRLREGIVAALTLLVALSLPWQTANADPVSAGQAEAMVKGWIKLSASPLGAKLGAEIKEVVSFHDDQARAAYYVVYLNPSGFAIVPADDFVEPIVAFASGGRYDPSPSNPFGALASQDLLSRVVAVRRGRWQAAAELRERIEEAQRKWRWFADPASALDSKGIGSVSDERVAPLVASRWSQTSVSGNACYNYYTPPNAAGSASNYPCGCVATAMAQLMRFHQHPAVGVGTGSFTIYVNGSAQTRSLRGGNGLGGTYAWGSMTLVPTSGVTLAGRQAIGALCHDAGVSVNMSYTSSGSGTDTRLAANAFRNTFDYANAVRAWNSGSNFTQTNLHDMLNPNLDAALPTLLGISGSVGGHAIVCDGYGYSSSTLYHHLNMGWAGSSDAWYALPNINSSPGFTTVYKVIYNVFETGSGEIISGRVVDDAGLPISGANVTAVRTGGGTYPAVTNAKGIYALAHVPSGSSYTVSAAKPGYTFANQSVSTGTSTDNAPASGNVWGVDFTSGGSGLPAPVLAAEPASTPGTSNTIYWSHSLGAGRFRAAAAEGRSEATISPAMGPSFGTPVQRPSRSSQPTEAKSERRPRLRPAVPVRAQGAVSERRPPAARAETVRSERQAGADSPCSLAAPGARQGRGGKGQGKQLVMSKPKLVAYSIRLPLRPGREVSRARALGVADARPGSNTYEVPVDVAAKLRGLGISFQVLGGVSEFTILPAGERAASPATTGSSANVTGFRGGMMVQPHATGCVSNTKADIRLEVERGKVSAKGRPLTGSPEQGKTARPARGRTGSRRAKRLLEAGPPCDPGEEPITGSASGGLSPLGTTTGRIDLSSGTVNMPIEDATGYGQYYRLRSQTAPAGAQVTNLEYRTRIDDEGDGYFYCGDYEIWLFSGDVAWETRVYDNRGGSTDGGYDDDPENDADIYLNWRSTHHFDGQDPNQWWGIMCYDNQSDDDGRMNYIDFRVHWQLSSPDYDFAAVDVYGADPSNVQTPVSTFSEGDDVAICFKWTYAGPNPSPNATIASQLDSGTVHTWRGQVDAGTWITSWTWSGATAGTHRIRGWCDYNNEVAESSETNNTRDESSAFSVQSSYDFAAVDVYGADPSNIWSPVSTFGEGDDVEICFRWTYTGPNPSPSATMASKLDEGSLHTSRYQYSPGTWCTHWTWSGATAGTHRIRGWCDYNSEVAESSETNNSRDESSAFSVQSSCDFAAVDVYGADPSNVQTPVSTFSEGDDVAICFKWTYAGSNPSPEATAAWQLDSGTVHTWRGQVDAGTWITHWTWSGATAGTHRIRGWCDYNNEISESSETNNARDESSAFAVAESTVYFYAECDDGPSFGSPSNSGWTEQRQWTFTGLTPGARYYYRVKAKRGTEESPWSNVESSTQQLQTFTISGRVSFGGGGLAGVVLDGLPGSPTTNVSGDYSATVNRGWSGTVTPQRLYYAFSPPSRTYSNVTSNRTDQDYTAALMRTLSITKSGAGKGGILLNGHSRGLPYSGTFADGTTLSLEADPAHGSTFVGWTGDVTGSTNPVILTLTRDINITVLIEPMVKVLFTTNVSKLPIPVYVDAVPHPTPYGTAFGRSTTHTIGVSSPYSVDPGRRLVWASWAHGGPQWQTIIGPGVPLKYCANFGIEVAVAATVSPPGTGEVTLTPSIPTGWYPSGSKVRFTATPATGYMLAGWVFVNIGKTNRNPVLLDVGKMAITAVAYMKPLVTSLPMPQALAPIGEGAPGPVAFEWTEVKDTRCYDLWVACEGSDAPVLTLNGVAACKTEAVSGLPAGDYEWWVRAQSDEGTSGWSAPAHFSLRPEAVRQLPAPRPIAPLDVANAGEVTFTWTEAPGAASYDLWVGLGKEPVCRKTGLAGTACKVQLDPGAYRWAVRASAAGAAGTWSPLVAVTVK